MAANLAYAAIEANRHASADAARLLRTHRDALAVLRSYAGAESEPAALANLFEHLERLGKTYGVRVAGFDADAPPALPKADTGDRNLKGEDFVLRLRGPFRGLLLFERRLSSEATLVRVDTIDFESAPAAGRRITVSSTVHARLFHLMLAKDEDL